MCMFSPNDLSSGCVFTMCSSFRTHPCGVHGAAWAIAVGGVGVYLLLSYLPSLCILLFCCLRGLSVLEMPLHGFWLSFFFCSR